MIVAATAWVLFLSPPGGGSWNTDLRFSDKQSCEQTLKAIDRKLGYIPPYNTAGYCIPANNLAAPQPR